MNNQQQANFPSIDEKELYRLAPPGSKPCPSQDFSNSKQKKSSRNF